MSEYTKEMEVELVKAAEEAKWTYASTKEWAEEHGLKHRSVIAKVKSLGLEYEPKPARVTKRGEPVVTKAQLIEAIEAAIGVELVSLSKMTKADLTIMVEVVKAEMPEPR